MLGPHDVGHRVVVRRVVDTRDGRPRYTDALGELDAITDTELTVRTRSGPVTIARAAVVAAKRIPAQTVTRRQIAALEQAANAAWPAPERQRLGEWWLRAADGWTGRANSALPVGDPGMPLGAAIDAVQQWYAARGQRPLINVPMPLAAAVNGALDGLGWLSGPPTLVQTAQVATILDRTATPQPPAPVRLVPAPTPDWLALCATRKGDLPAAARHILTAVDQVRFAEVYADGTLVAIGRGTVTDPGRWLGISLLEVVPAARRRGLARQVVRALAQWAASAGAQAAYLQVEQHNTAAVALYTQLGFRAHHHYLTRYLPPEPPRRPVELAGRSS